MDASWARAAAGGNAEKAAAAIAASGTLFERDRKPNEVVEVVIDDCSLDTGSKVRMDDHEARSIAKRFKNREESEIMGAFIARHVLSPLLQMRERRTPVAAIRSLRKFRRPAMMMEMPKSGPHCFRYCRHVWRLSTPYIPEKLDVQPWAITPASFDAFINDPVAFGDGVDRDSFGHEQHVVLLPASQATEQHLDLAELLGVADDEFQLASGIGIDEFLKCIEVDPASFVAELPDAVFVAWVV